MLSSAHPGTTFGRTRVHTLPYGQQSQEKRHTMALGALDLIEDDAAPSLFGTGATVAHGTGANVETEGSQDMILPRDAADLVIMNPPFTRPTNHERDRGASSVICWIEQDRRRTAGYGQAASRDTSAVSQSSRSWQRGAGFQLH